MEPAIQAVNDYLIIEPQPSEVEGGKIIIPDAAKESMKADAEWATIVSVGSECDENLEEGRLCLVLLGSCLTLPPENGKGYLLCKNSRVVAVK